MTDTKPVVLCDGSGTRPRPLSRTGFLKQFLCLTGKETRCQHAALRLTSFANVEIQVAPSINITGRDHRFLALGEVHPLANPGAIPLKFIEVQFGSPPEEHDIAIFEDITGVNDNGSN